MERIYLDFNATTPLDPRVLEAMLPVLQSTFGNASSIHWFGQRARALVEEARETVAAFVGADSGEIVFTGGGTESDNAALRGALAAASPERRKVLVSATDHHAVTHTAEALRREGASVVVIRSQTNGSVDLEDLAAKLDDATLLVAVMAANNEVGIVQPGEQVAQLAHARGALFLSDAVQAAGKLRLDVNDPPVDLMALSAHKLYGPKGVGALYVRRGTRIKPLIHGGGQERNRRAGTENVAAVVGFAAAVRLASADLASESRRLRGLRDRIEQRLVERAGAERNGEEPRVPNTASLSFPGVEAERLVMALDLAGVAVSTGAACSAGAIEPSHVLKAMGLPPARVQSSVRISLGRSTTPDEIDEAAARIEKAVERQRGGNV
jgi:cysteine desulfurase